MIKIKNLTVKNFMSVGNQTQAVDFDKGHLTLVLGENLDLGGDGSGSRNGTGKTTIINGLSYAIYGNALTSIKKDNLVNKINNKAMLVTMSFEKDGIDYKIERGRKPNLLKFTINGSELKSQDQDESQGDSRETQKAIEEVFGMTHDMFKHILALNTYTEPFLSMKAGDQREIIEQLLGITILSEKADALKEGVRFNKELISQENTKIETIKISNEKIQLSIDALERKQKLWLQTKDETIARLRKDIKAMQSVDIDKEIANQRLLIDWNQHRKDLDSVISLLARQQTVLDKEQRVLDKLDQELVLLAEHKCHSCGQEVHDDQYETMVSAKQTQQNESKQAITTFEEELSQFKEALTLLGPLPDCPAVTYNTLEQALNHKNTLDNLEKDATAKVVELDPYQDQVDELKNTAVQAIDWNNINELTKLKDHQEFLLKLLTNKDSFIRKKIIDQNLSFLNNRLTHYLERIGLPHEVRFQNDLTVLITQLGQDLDFDNLSRGERNRLILSLSFAFRDVWENLYQGINLLFIDELVDSGMDASGVESSISILKKMARERDKNIFLISHRDDLANRVNQVLRVVKENGFTSYANDVDII